MRVNPQRVSVIGSAAARKGRYVLYWMQQSQRAEANDALEYAVGQANKGELPLLVGFGLMDDYPEANLRHYRFMLEGLAGTSAALARRGIRMAVVRGNPAEVAVRLGQEAAMVVCDRGYMAHQRRWRDQVADGAGCAVVQVEADMVVPVEATSDHAEFAARTIRPKIARQLDQFLAGSTAQKLKRDSMSIKVALEMSVGDIDAALDKLKLDRSVAPSGRFIGGTENARRHLRRFIDEKLKLYAEDRSEPAAGINSYMSPYLQFGQISAVEIALAVRESGAPQAAKDSYLEELIVRRELACNFTQYTPNYWTYDALPGWARRSLEKHAGDRRGQVYSRAQLENAETGDPYWNASMREMSSTGYMHNYMRMYWGKCVLGWKAHPREAFADLIYLNNKYFIDGRGPNGFAGVAWCFGLHDRPWGEREIFGQVRYMNAAGLKRKFDMDAYIRAVGEMSGQM